MTMRCTFAGLSIWLLSTVIVNAQSTADATDSGSATDTPRSARSNARSSYVRLARAPNMFGDSYSLGGQLTLQIPGATIPPVGSNQPPPPDMPTNIVTDIILGGGRGIKIAENSSTLPVDRVYFIYNHFHNAISVPQGPPQLLGDQNVNQYVAGFEKTFADGNMSLDIRMPLRDEFQQNSPGFSQGSGVAGNLTLYLKQLLYATPDFALGSGIGVGLPTGADTFTRVVTDQYVIENDAVHLLPYLCMLYTPNEDWFVQSFVQFDFAANGNEVRTTVPQNQQLGLFTEQNLLFLDVTVGRWLYENEQASLITRVAGILELHYTSTIQDTDTVTNPASNFGPFVLSNQNNRLDILNLTSGLHFQCGTQANFRIGGVVPLKLEPNRQFDSEVQFSFNYFY